MNFTIFSVDDSRDLYTGIIRAQLGMSFWWKERPTWCINGTDPETLRMARGHFANYIINSPGIKTGQLGIWYTVLNAMIELRGEPFVTFEDDAILNPRFNEIFWRVTSDLPNNTDAFSLFLPRDHDHLYRPRVVANPHLVPAYQRYGGVSMLWTPKGVDRFLRLVERDGITDQWDNQLYKYAAAGAMNVYTQPPGPDVLVSITGSERSIVQESEEI